ncbi:uncharacterized protein [Triticum aestivum]|uniref:uncharacterized protein n=1 Tax=Triticum aestivum TaxID=4565 RepID=UPI001D021A47|nr:uncharacterized protein LOC123111912 [Triticum aestivum]XP_044388728.1 uncharacterized protein LOC123111912 [Triticum aestivum]
MTSRISAPPGACRGRRRSPCACRRASGSRGPRAPSAWCSTRTPSAGSAFLRAASSATSWSSSGSSPIILARAPSCNSLASSPSARGTWGSSPQLISGCASSPCSSRGRRSARCPTARPPSSTSGRALTTPRCRWRTLPRSGTTPASATLARTASTCRPSSTRCRGRNRTGAIIPGTCHRRCSICARVSEMREREVLTETDLNTAFIRRRVLPLQQHTHIIGQMAGLQDPNRMSNLRLGADQVARWVNDISKAGLRDDWEFGKSSYSQANPVPVVSPWSPYFATAHLLVRPDATQEVLLNAIWHPYDRPGRGLREAATTPSWRRCHGWRWRERLGRCRAGHCWWWRRRPLWLLSQRGCRRRRRPRKRRSAESTPWSLGQGDAGSPGRSRLEAGPVRYSSGP